MEEKLYHGTCRAFVEYARQRENKFGPENSNIYLTPDLNHARMFAEGWNTDRGRKLLEEYFGKELPIDYSNGVIFEYDAKELGKLEIGIDAGGIIEIIKEKGPIPLGRELNEFINENDM